MAKVYLHCTRKDGIDLPRLQVAAVLDRFHAHTLVESPNQADLILFSDPASPDMGDIREDPVYRQNRSRSFVYATGDRVLPFVPGIFTCPEKTTHPEHRSRTGPYLRVPFEFDYSTHGDIDQSDPPADELLFSFVGRVETASVRARLLQLSHPRAVLIDASIPGQSLASMAYRHLLARSRFVLCPRGYGSSSFRLFETLRAGRIPVIVSDEWIPCSGPSWPSFSLTIREDQVGFVPEILEEKDCHYLDMQQAARQAWAEWFAPDVIFHRLVEWCLELHSYHPDARQWDDRLYRLGRLRPSMLRWYWAGRQWRRHLRASA